MLHVQVGITNDPPYTFKVPMCGGNLIKNFDIFVNNAKCNYHSNETSSVLPKEQWKGLMVDFIETAAKLENFTYRYVEQLDGSYGRLRNYTTSTSSRLYWDGLLGQLKLGFVDVNAAPMGITSERKKDFDFVPIINDPSEFFISKKFLAQDGGAQDSWFQFDYLIKPFHLYTWLVIITNGAFLALFLTMLELVIQSTMLNNSRRSLPVLYWPRRTVHTIYNMWESITGIFLSQEATFLPVSASAKMLLIISTLACVALTSLYSAQMASMAIVKSPRAPFDSFVSMRTAGYRLLIMDNGAAIDKLNELENALRTQGDDDEAQALREQLQEPISGWPPTAAASYVALRENKFTGSRKKALREPHTIFGPFVTFTTHSRMALQQTPNCDLIPVNMRHPPSVDVGSDNLNLVFRNDKPNILRQKFIRAIKKMRQSAIDRHYFQQSMPVYNSYSTRLSQNAGSWTMSTQLVCGGIWQKQKWLVGGNWSRQHPERLSSPSEKKPAEGSNFKALSIYDMRSVFFVLVLGAAVGGSVLLVEWSLTATGHGLQCSSSVTSKAAFGGSFKSPHKSVGKRNSV